MLWSTEKGVSNFKFINHRFISKAIANRFVQNLQNTKTSFKKEILHKDTSDILLVTDLARKLIKEHKY